MRIMPACLFVYKQVKDGVVTEEEGLKLIHDVSALTHAHLRSKIACGFYYFLVKTILDGEGTLISKLQQGVDDAVRFYGRDCSNLVQMTYYGRLFHLDKFAETPETMIKSSGYVVDSLEAAVWSLITTDSLEEALLKAVNLGGDTDTIGAIAGGLAALHYGYENIPRSWRETIVKRDKIMSLCGLAEGK
jgi:ADP-ribosylglycohydrolase